MCQVSCSYALCVRICVFYCTMCLASWPLSTEAARRRCGSDLLSDLLFVCGDRGIYIGRGTWSGYGARPRGKKGIVDQCCRSGGCDLHHLEKYCAKPKTRSQQHTTTSPSTTTKPQTSTHLDLAQQFEALLQNKLLETLGAPNSPKRDSYRKKTHNSRQQKNRYSSSRRRRNIKHTAKMTETSTSLLQRVTMQE
uniref:Insulin-like domain-containing protein n=1 Tax=Sphaeramia orbicularis TaxID=375764 RepID=A0A672YIU0_9TELE